MFDYCAVLIAVILGLALIHLLRGLARQMQMRHDIRPYWVHILWTIDVIIWVLAIWWGMFWWRGLQELTAPWFYFLIGYAVLQFLWAAILYPPEFSAGLDFEDYFFSNRYWFFGIQAAVILMDIPETLVKGAAHLRPVPEQYPYLISGLLIVTALALLSRNRRLHGALSVAWLLLTLGYVFFIPLMSRIVGH
ncbi:MAG TPA: hypothetical protein VIY54_00900 [Steroidobacteraceae bacterium]